IIPVAYAGLDATDSMVVGFSSAGEAGGMAGYHVDNTLFVDKVEVYASEATSVAAVQKVNLGFEVYPNPATGIINFDNKANTAGTTLIIQNSVGQVMHYARMN